MAASIRCSLCNGCELLKRLASNTRQTKIHHAIANALRDNANVATILHDQFGIAPLLAVQLAKVFSDARRDPPSTCSACGDIKIAA